MTFHEDLLDLEIPQHIRISPDMKSVVYSTCLSNYSRKGEHAVSTIWLAQLGQPRSARQLTNGRYHDREPQWSPDGTSIAFLSDRSQAGQSTAIYILPLTGGDPLAVTPAENERSIEAFEFSPDGRSIAFLSADEKTAEKKADEKTKEDIQVWGEDWPYNRLRLVDLSTKQIKTLISTEAHIQSIAWSDTGSSMVFTTCETPDIESWLLSGTALHTLDVRTKDTTKLCVFPCYVSDLACLDQRIYFIGNVSEKEVISGTMVYTVDLQGPRKTQYQKHAFGVENCAASLANRHQSVIVEVEHGMQNQLCLPNGKVLFSEGKLITGWDAACANDGEEAIIAVAMNSTSKATEVYSTAGPNGGLVQLSEHGASLEGRDLGSASFVSCLSFDNKVTLDAVWHNPPGHQERAKPLPTVVVIHGGPYTRHNDSIDNTYFLYGPLLLAAGYGLLVPNYRGNSSRGDGFAGYIRDGGEYEYDDVIALTQHAIDKGYADPNRLVVTGYSYGGFLAYISAVRNGLHGHGWKFRAVVAGGGTCDMDTEIFTSDLGLWEVACAGKAPWKCKKSDTSNRAKSAIWEFDAAVKRGDVIPPILMLHGENDVRVPLEQPRGFRRALQTAGLLFEYVVYSGEGHFIGRRKHLLDYGQRVVAFVAKHIG